MAEVALHDLQLDFVKVECARQGEEGQSTGRNFMKSLCEAGFIVPIGK